MTDALELVGLPVGGPTTLPQVKGQLNIPAGDVADDEALQLVVDAVNSQVRTWRVSQAAVDAETWPARISLGATILGARLWRRRNSPAGVEVFASGGPVYVSRNDPDVAQLLQLGVFSPPSVG